MNEYDAEGNLIGACHEKKFMELTDEAYEAVKKDHPELTIGYVFFGLKFIPPEENEKLLTPVFEIPWDKTIGIDFVQQEDPNGSQKPYDELADKMLAKYPERKFKKVYHCGETKDHLNNNI